MKNRETDNFVKTNVDGQWESRYPRDSWPAYAYPKRKPLKLFGILMAIAFGLGLGSIAAAALWRVLEPVEHHMLYPDELDAIAAKWTGEPIVFNRPLSDVVKASGYYGAPEWNALNPIEENGTITLRASTKADMAAFVQLVRDEIIRLADEYAEDESFYAFSSAAFSDDYHTATVQTKALKESLISKPKSEELLNQMKIQALFYDQGDSTSRTCRVAYVNTKENTVIAEFTK